MKQCGTANVYKLGNIYFASRFSAASFEKAIIMINSHKFVTSNGELMYIHALIDGSSSAPVVDGCSGERQRVHW